VFFGEIVVSAAIGVFEIDPLVRPWLVVLDVTAATGLALSNTVLLVALADAAGRAAGSADDRLIAGKIVSSLSRSHRRLRRRHPGVREYRLDVWGDGRRVGSPGLRARSAPPRRVIRSAPPAFAACDCKRAGYALH
jgi:hypothetical protein